MASNTLFSVAKALSEIESTDSTIKLLTMDLSMWNMFGKKDSHLLRAKLFKLMNEAKLDNESKFIVFFFFAIIKNRNRVLASYDELPQEVKAIPSVMKAREFIRDIVVQYTSQESAKKFAAIHLPTTMPGLDIMLTALTIENNNEALANSIYTKQTFCQIHINSELQTLNKAAQQMFWNTIVKTSRKTPGRASR